MAKLRQGLTATPAGRTILYSRAYPATDDLMLVENFRSAELSLRFLRS
jgi:hypothetical protein